MFKGRRVSLAASLAVAGAIVLSGCGGGGDSTTPETTPETTPTVETTTVDGKVYDGPVWGAKVCAYDANNNELGCAETGEDGSYTLEVEGTPVYLKAVPQSDSYDIGFDGKFGTTDDVLFSDVLVTDYADSTNITPLTYIRHLGKDVSKGVEVSDMLDMQVVVSAVDMLKKLGLTAEEAYKVVTDSIDAPQLRSLQKIVITKAAIEKAAPTKAATIPTALVEKVAEAVSNIATVISNIAQSISAGASIADVQNKLVAVQVVAKAVAKTASDTMQVVQEAIAQAQAEGKSVEEALASVEAQVAEQITKIESLAGTDNIETVVETVATIVESASSDLSEGVKLDITKVAEVVADKAEEVASGSTEVVAEAVKTEAVVEVPAEPVTSSSSSVSEGASSSAGDITDEASSSVESSVSSESSSSSSSVSGGGDTYTGGDSSSSSSTPTYSPTATIPVVGYSMLEANATLTESNLTVDKVDNAINSDGNYSLLKYAITLDNEPNYSDTAQVDAAFTAIESKLSNYLDINLSVASVPSNLNKDVNVTVYVKGDDGGWLSATVTDVQFTKDGENLKVNVPADAKLQLCGQFGDVDTVCATKVNEGANYITSSGNKLNFNASGIISKFANNDNIASDTVKKNMVKYTTNENNYTVSLVIVDSNGQDFIGNDTNVNMDVPESALWYANEDRKAVNVNLGIVTNVAPTLNIPEGNQTISLYSGNAVNQAIGTASDPYGDTLTCSTSITDWNCSIAADGTVTLKTPTLTTTDTNSVTLTVTDPFGESASGSVNVSVNVDETSSYQRLIPYYEANKWNYYVDDNNDSQLQENETTLLNTVEVTKPSDNSSTPPNIKVSRVVTLTSDQLQSANVNDWKKISFYTDQAAQNINDTSDADLILNVYINSTNGFKNGDVIAVEFNSGIKTYTITGNE